MKINKINFVKAAALFSLCMGIISCASTSVKEEALPQNQNQAQKSSSHAFKLTDEEIQPLLDSALISTGSSSNLRKQLERIQNGEAVYVAAIGGSVTEGQGPGSWRFGYAYQFVNLLKKEFKGELPVNVIFQNAGLCGTPSLLGCIRYSEDVVKASGHVPDILVIEFAVNDNTGNDCQRGYESIIRQALKSNPEMAVIALYSAATYGNTLYTMNPISQYYGLAEINVLSGVKKAQRENIFNDVEYYTDTVHPTKDGHLFEAECLINLCKKAFTEEKQSSVEIPAAPFVKNAFENPVRITKESTDVILETGGFNSTDTQVQGHLKDSSSAFPENFYHSPSSSNQSMKITVECKSFIIATKDNGSWTGTSFGEAEIYVDGKLTQTVSGQTSSGWNNPVTSVLIDEETASEHTIEIKMKKEDENKGFTVLAMAYCK